MARAEMDGSRAQQLAREIRNQIEAGQLRDGQALPSTRQLALEWDTSLTTVTGAMKILEADGLVISRDRVGRTVNAPGQAARLGRPVMPQTVLIGGYAGSGKSELGRIMVRATGWALLDKDTMSRPVVEAALEVLGQSPADREGPTYMNVVRPAEYLSLSSTMLENLDLGTSVVAAAPFLQEFTSRPWLDRMIAACESLGAAVTIVWVRCDAATMHAYLRHRGAARDAWKLSHWDEYVGGLDFQFTPDVEHVVVDNSAGSRPLQHQAADILRQISASAN